MMPNAIFVIPEAAVAVGAIVLLLPNSNLFPVRRNGNSIVASAIFAAIIPLLNLPGTSAASSSSSLMVLGVLFSLQKNIFNVTSTAADNGTVQLPIAIFIFHVLLESLDLVRSGMEVDLFPGQSDTSTLANDVAAASISMHDFNGHTTIAAFLAGNSTGEKSGFLPVFEMVLGAVTYLIIIFMTVIGNLLVVAAVLTYKFLVSLAASDLLVAIVVMPLHDGHWLLGVTVCQLFTTADILLCTSSILNLCAIALDRYWAIHNPIDYAQKRTPKFVVMVIVLVWFASAGISVPPLIGWNDWTSQKLKDHCELTTDKTFVVFSASGSFFVPLVIMIIVYVKIFISARQRIRTNRGRSALVRISKATAHSQAPSSVPTGGGFSLCPVTKTSSNALQPPRAASLVVNSANFCQATNVQPHKMKTKRSSSHSHSLASLSLNPFNKMTGRRGVKVSRNNSDGGVAVQEAAARLFLQTEDKKRLAELWPAAQIDTDGPTKVVDDNTDNGAMKQIPQSLSNDHQQPGNGALILCDERTNTTIKSSSSDSTQRSASIVAETATSVCSNPMPHPGKPGKGNGLKTQFKFDENMPKKSTAATNGTLPCSVGQTLDTAVLKNHEKISVAKEKRAAKTTVIIFVFTFCWLPFFCAYVILPFCESCSLHPKVHQAFVWLGYINSSLNPFLYGILNMEFRRAFRKILCTKSYLNSQKRRSLGDGRKGKK